MKVCFHDPQNAEAEIMHSNGYGPFCTLDFKSSDGEVTLFLRAHKMNAARAIADIFNADLPALVSRIEDAMMAVHDAEVDFRTYATAIACDLIGKDLDEALRKHREAEDAE